MNQEEKEFLDSLTPDNIMCLLFSDAMHVLHDVEEEITRESALELLKEWHKDMVSDGITLEKLLGLRGLN